jgi:uncharacterized membrane protein
LRQVTAINTAAPIKETSKNIGFRWAYIAAPAAVLLIAVVIAASLYGKLPQETAYRFSGGVPVSRLDRAVFLAWALGLQLVFVLLALALTFSITSAARRIQLAETPLNRMLFAIIGNIVALPQIIIAYAMLDIFLYNIYEKAFPPLWVFAVVVMFAGGVILAVFFARAVAQSRKLKTEKISGSKTDVRK